jgi:hypothetical protein
MSFELIFFCAAVRDRLSWRREVIWRAADGPIAAALFIAAPDASTAAKSGEMRGRNLWILTSTPLSCPERFGIAATCANPGKDSNNTPTKTSVSRAALRTSIEFLTGF